jgi:hypothetical protein
MLSLSKVSRVAHMRKKLASCLNCWVLKPILMTIFGHCKL